MSLLDKPRQGEALGVGEDEVHLVLEEDWRNKGDRKAWVKKEWITKVRGDEKVWRWPHLSMTRDVKLQMLYEAGLYTLIRMVMWRSYQRRVSRRMGFILKHWFWDGPCSGWSSMGRA